MQQTSSGILIESEKGNSKMLLFNLACKNLYQYKCGKLRSQTVFDQSWNAERKVSAGKYVTARGDKSVQKRGVMLRINARKRDLWRTPGIRRAPHQDTHWYILYRGTLDKQTHAERMMMMRMLMRLQELLIASTCHPIVMTGNLATRGGPSGCYQSFNPDWNLDGWVLIRVKTQPSGCYQSFNPDWS